MNPSYIPTEKEWNQWAESCHEDQIFVARSMHASESALRKLGSSTNNDIIRALVANRKTMDFDLFYEIIERLPDKDTDFIFHIRLLEEDNPPKKLIAYCANSHFLNPRKSASKCPETDKEIIAQLTKDVDLEVQVNAYIHPNCPVDLLCALFEFEAKPRICNQSESFDELEEAILTWLSQFKPQENWDEVIDYRRLLVIAQHPGTSVKMISQLLRILNDVPFDVSSKLLPLVCKHPKFKLDIAYSDIRRSQTRVT